MSGRFRVRAVIAIAALLVASGPGSLEAADDDGRIRLIRDTEVENIIRLYSAPVFAQAGMEADAIKVHLVDDKRLNAFVAGGLHMFINTGLLMRGENAGQVIGVIAHETGHIAGGHLARFRQSLQAAQVRSILAFLLGAAAGVLAQDSQAGLAVMSLGAKATEGALLRYSRTQESSADQFAVNALDGAGISSRGYMEFLQILQNQEFLATARQDPYVRTHPVTSSRVEFVRNHLAHSPHAGDKLPARFAVLHKRMRAKLFGFLQYPLQVLARYDASDTSIDARYARAIALYRDAKERRAIKVIDGLIAEFPEDPYFRELRGQVLFENGKVAPSVASYRESVRLMPRAPLLRAALGQALLELGGKDNYAEALRHLKEAVRRENDNPTTWRFLGIAYGRNGDKGMASLALAESGLLMGDLPLVKGHVRRAERLVRKGSPAWQRVQDIKRAVDEADRQQQRSQ